jgi:hypothetical protein
VLFLSISPLVLWPGLTLVFHKKGMGSLLICTLLFLDTLHCCFCNLLTQSKQLLHLLPCTQS